jgi:tetratricopeptide (TPR) repeat protein
MRVIVLIAFFLGMVVTTTVAQQENSKLADQYYLDGEYEKAAQLYEDLYKLSNRSDYYFTKYIECLLAMEEYDRGENIIRQRISENPSGVSLYVTLGNVLERQNRLEEADATFADAIENLPPDIGEITKLGNNFLMLTKYDMAIQTFELGQKLINRPALFANNLADLYRRKGEYEKMIENYLYSLHANPKRITQIQTIFQRYLPKEDLDMLLSQLYGMIQEYPDVDHFQEMLAWVFVQKKEFESALRQVKALDIRLEENGQRVYRIARMASNAKESDVAIEAYEYIVKEKGPRSAYYMEAKRLSLIERRRKIVRNYDYTEEDLRALEHQYNSFLDEAGRNRTTAPIIAELARLQAFYINDLDAAITLLQEVVSYPGVQKKVRANAKLDLADFQLMNGEIWEATLLYSQVDKAFREDPLGQEARFRNARLSYFNADFEWAQAQFDILKASTSRMIANDALDMSVFIMDNLGLDTTDHPLTVYAESELLVFQNRFEEAFSKLNILSNVYPDHGLQDDILYLKAQIYMQQRKFEEAGELYQEIADSYPDEIRADNSLYALAQLYEDQLDNVAKAQDLYEKLFMEYSGSTFAIEARKRYRILRGDFIEEENLN